MSIFSVNKGAKSRAIQYEALATNLQGQQRDVDFGRVLLSNIRQERLARAQLRASSYSDDTVSSSGMGAVANIDSSLAGEMGYSYETSERAEKIQNYQQKAQAEWKKYQKSIQRAGMAGQIMGTVGSVVGAVVGTVVAPGLGTAVGATLGSAVGGAAGTGLTAAMGGGHVATGAAARSAISGTITTGMMSAITPGAVGDDIIQISDTGVREVIKRAPTNMQLLKNYGGVYSQVAQSAWGAGGYSQQQMRGMW